MTSFKLALILFLAKVNFVSSDTTSSGTPCGAEIAAHHQCLIKSKNLEGQQSQTGMSRKELQDGIEKCFIDNGCKKPTLEDHETAAQVPVAVPHPNADIYTKCFDSCASMSKSSQESCIRAKLPGFSFFASDSKQMDTPNKNEASTAYGVSFWVYEVGAQMHDPSICPKETKLASVKSCCKDLFGKAFVNQCNNPYDNLLDGAKRYMDSCTASQNCTKALSPACKQQYNASFLIIKECLRNEQDKESKSQNYSNTFLNCMRDTKEPVSNYLMQPKIAKFHMEMAINKWAETISHNTEFICDEKAYYDQYRPKSFVPQEPTGSFPPNQIQTRTVPPSLSGQSLSMSSSRGTQPAVGTSVAPPVSGTVPAVGSSSTQGQGNVPVSSVTLASTGPLTPSVGITVTAGQSPVTSSRIGTAHPAVNLTTPGQGNVSVSPANLASTGPPVTSTTKNGSLITGGQSFVTPTTQGQENVRVSPVTPPATIIGANLSAAATHPLQQTSQNVNPSSAGVQSSSATATTKAVAKSSGEQTTKKA